MASSSLLVPPVIIILFLFRTISCVSYAESDTIKPGQQLRDWEQLVSEAGVFRLGFFTPEKSTNFELGSAGPRYIGVWFNRIPFYSVWVANPNNPVQDSSGALTVDTNGILKITHSKGSPIVLNPKTTRFSSFAGGNVSATLLDSGNFVIRQIGPDGVPGRVVWQSFDYPSNILLPGMKIGFNLKTGAEISVTSWISDQVPSPGAFRLGLDPSGLDQLLVWRRNEVYWSSGIWKNGTSKLTLDLSKQYIDYEFEFHTDKNQRYFSYSVKNSGNGSVLSRWDLDTLGQITVFNLVQEQNSSSWIFETSGPCSTDLKNQSAICITEKASDCRKGSEYFEPKRGYINQFVPFGRNMDQFGYGDYNVNLGLSDCHASCWKNCSCIAFQTSTRDGRGCLFWTKGSKFVQQETSDDFVYILRSGKQ